jgi:hypothetical protein
MHKLADHGQGGAHVILATIHSFRDPLRITGVFLFQFIPGNTPPTEVPGNLIDTNANTKWVEFQPYINAVYFALNAVSAECSCEAMIISGTALRGSAKQWRGANQTDSPTLISSVTQPVTTYRFRTGDDAPQRDPVRWALAFR